MKKSMAGFALILALLCALAAPEARAAAVVYSWGELQDALLDGGEVELGSSITAGTGDRCLDISDTIVVLDLKGHTLNRDLSGGDAVDSGEVIAIGNGGNLTLRDSSPEKSGKITGGNTVDSGGGVSLSGGTFTMEGGAITGNSAQDGGGVDIYGGTFTMTGGKISGNTAHDSGGGVRVYSGAFKISGAPEVTGNRGLGGRDDNVYVLSDTVITAAGPLEGGAKIGVRKSSGGGVFTSGLSEHGGADVLTGGVFTSDDPAYKVASTGDGKEAQLVRRGRVSYTVAFRVSGGLWNDGTDGEKTVVLSRNENEDLLLKLEDGDIPAVGSRPGKGHRAGGSWDVTPDTETVISGDRTYTYTYARAGTAYSVTAGDGQTWYRGTTNPARFTFKGSPSDADTFANFTGIRVNGVDVSEKKYAAEPGSVVVTLKADYLEGLKDGSHRLTAVFTDGEADAGFKVAQSPGRKPADTGDMPKTGDGSQPALWAALALISLAALAVRSRRKG